MLIQTNINSRLNESGVEHFTVKFSSYSLMFMKLYEFNSKAIIKNVKVFKFILLTVYKFPVWDIRTIEAAQIYFLELVNFTRSWRRIKTYPVNGQSTHTNSKMVKKHKILLTFRVNQFFQQFGVKKRNIYPTLIIAEYTNRLWFETWFDEWIQARIALPKLVKPQTKTLFFDPVNLAKNITTGYKRFGKASKIGKKKKINTVTIGLPIFFSRYLYYSNIPRGFPYKLNLSDSDRRKMGKKRKKNIKKKK